MNKKYEEIEFLAGNTIKEAVNELLRYREKGQLVFGSFNGHLLYSDTVTMDSAYKEITGKTKVEFDMSQQEMIDRLNKEELEHKQQIPKLTNHWRIEGKKVLSEDKWEYWDKIVPIRLNDLYRGMELSYCLDIIKILNNNGTLEEAKEKIENQGHSGMSLGLVCTMVKEFCSRGQEFVDYMR